MLARFKAMLKPGGRLSLADLESEDGTFHDDNSDVAHFGFDTTWFAGQLDRLGLENVKIRTIHSVTKPRGDILRSYPVFHASARLPFSHEG
ncbi:MAG: hypothetical protein WC360_06295, partial [Opitutales bacterium]|jgi:hypothetical protein